jgi:hypothetical protein
VHESRKLNYGPQIISPKPFLLTLWNLSFFKFYTQNIIHEPYIIQQSQDVEETLNDQSWTEFERSNVADY